MKLPEAPERWSKDYQSRLNQEIETALKRRRERGDLEMERTAISGATRHERIILSSPDGTRYAIVVANDGTLSASAV